MFEGESNFLPSRPPPQYGPYNPDRDASRYQRPERPPIPGLLRTHAFPDASFQLRIHINEGGDRPLEGENLIRWFQEELKKLDNEFQVQNLAIDEDDAFLERQPIVEVFQEELALQLSDLLHAALAQLSSRAHLGDAEAVVNSLDGSSVVEKLAYHDLVQIPYKQLFDLAYAVRDAYRPLDDILLDLPPLDDLDEGSQPTET